MNRKQIKDDKAVQSIIINSLNKINQYYLSGCRTVYQMMQRLKRRYYQSEQALFKYLWTKNQKFKKLIIMIIFIYIQNWMRKFK